MSAESGRKVSVGLGKETTRGTGVAPTYWGKQLDLDFQQKSDKQMNESGLGVLDKYNEAEVFKDTGAGKLSGKVTDRLFGLLLALTAGAAPSTATNADASGNVKDHTFTQSQSNTPLTATVAVKDNNRDERYPLASLSSLELNIATGDWVKFSAEFLSKKPTASAGNTVSYVAENEFKAKHVTVKLAADVAGLAGATAIPLRSMKLSWTKTLDDYMSVGSNDPYDIFLKESEIKGDFTMLFDSITHRDAYLNNTYQVMQVTIQNTDVVIGTAANPKLVLTFYKVGLSDWGLDQGLGNMVEQTIGLQGFYSLSDGKSWGGVLTNLVTSY
jgi:hypothetical protein